MSGAGFDSEEGRYLMNLLRWFFPWEISASIMIATAVSAVVYIRGSHLIKRSLPQKAFFGLGLLSMYAVTQTQFDYYAEHEFFAHQLQNAILHHLGPFLIVLSGAKDVLAAGLPPAGKRLLMVLLKGKPLQTVFDVLLHPACVTVLFVGLAIFWLLPSVQFIAMLDWRLYRLMNWCMALSGLMFWEVALAPNSLHSSGHRIAMMLAVVPPQILIGVIIFFTTRELYPVYTLCGRAFPGVGPITDQQIGGLILWTQGTMMSVIGILIVIRRELRPVKVIGD